MVIPWSDWPECYTTHGCGYGKTKVKLVRMLYYSWLWLWCQTGQNVILLMVVVMVRPRSDWSECYTTHGCGYGETKVRLVRMLYY